MVQTASERKELEGGELPAVIGNHEAARPGNGAERIYDAGVGHGDDVTGLQHKIAGSIPGLEDTIQINGNGVCDGRRNRVRSLASRSRSGVRGTAGSGACRGLWRGRIAGQR